MGSGEQLMRIPLRCAMTSAIARESPATYGVFTDPTAQAMLKNRSEAVKDYLALTMWLLDALQRQQFNSYKLFLRSLPRQLDNFPTFWSDKELELLPKSVLGRVASKRQAILKEYYTVSGLRHEFGRRFSSTDFLRAWLLVISRNYGLSRSSGRVRAMIPVADLFNHDRPANTIWYLDRSTDSFVLNTTEPLPMGANVRISYGRKSQSDLLCSYGFTLPCDSPRTKCVHELSLVHEGRAYYLTFSQSSTKPLLKRLAEKLGRGAEFDAFSALIDHEAARHGSLEDVQSRLRVAVSNKERDALRVVESHLRVLQFWKETPCYDVQ